mmetsp:Transcript_44791/g.74316  ORF Transcript_44791/g.74316 Transcript_44791/m.74316 type:complete len:296 (-) Transcript_44791:216-1103(-)
MFPRCRLLIALAPASAALMSLRLITLDLDDTLWPTGPVVQAANTKVADAIRAQPDLLQARLRAARSTVSPPSYSEARILAIQSLLNEREGTVGAQRAEAERLFDIWLAERHKAAGRLLFDGAVEAIAKCRREHPDAIIAAVTNGRGDPLAMPQLRPYFDFTISAEDDSIYPQRKPAPGPFLAALRKAGVQPQPALWAHVGDDLLNDVQAAKRLGAWSVWLDASASGRDGEPAASPDDAVAGSFWFSTMGDEERAARREAAGRALRTADAIIKSISELPLALSPMSRRRGRECPFP